jgi:primosomal replication protein N
MRHLTGLFFGVSIRSGEATRTTISSKKELAMNLNSVTLAGMVKVAPALSYSSNGVPVLRLLLKIHDETRAGKPFTIGVPVEVVGDRAEGLAETLDVGDYVVVSGKLQHRTNTNQASPLGVYGISVQKLKHQQEAAVRSSETDGEGEDV